MTYVYNGHVCQSCGMPLQCVDDYGTNSDGSRNEEYCHFCFQNGRFTDDGITLQQKIDRIVMLAVKHMNIPETKAREIANRVIPNLRRWQK
jgi:hypothetical protein